MTNGDDGGGGVELQEVEGLDTVSNPLQEPVIYVGPISTKLGLTYLQMYSEYTPIVQDAISANPALNLLMVPVSQFSAIRSQLFPVPQLGYIAHAVETLNAQGVL